MPLYEFRCPTCGQQTEELRKMADAVAETPCPCGGKMHRVYSHTVQGDTHYDGLRSLEGYDLSTRTKYRKHMKENNLCLMSDYTDTWAKAAKERAQLYDPENHGGLPKKYVEQAKRDLVESMHRLQSRR
jgi:putative FmdB family regulatory protein